MKRIAIKMETILIFILAICIVNPVGAHNKRNAPYYNSRRAPLYYFSRQAPPNISQQAPSYIAARQIPPYMLRQAPSYISARQAPPYKSPYVNRRQTSPGNSNICVSASCMETALTMMKNIDDNANPCDSFFQYACGNFEKRTIIPDDRSTVNQYNIIRDTVQDQIYFLLTFPNHTLTAFQKLQNLYDRCMDKAAIEKHGFQVVQETFESLGKWPLIAKQKSEDWNNDEFNWTERIYGMDKYGFSPTIFSVGISTDIKNNTRRIIEFDQPGLGLSKEYLDQGTKSAVVRAYQKLMKGILSLYFPGMNIDQEADEIYLFETKLSQIMMNKKERRNITLLYNTMSLKELKEANNLLDWTSFITTYLSPEVFTDDYIVNVNNPKFFKNLTTLLKETEKRIVANYMFWRLLHFFTSYLPENFTDLKQKFSSVTTGRNVKESRWKECIDTTSSNFAIAMGSLYVRHHFDKKAKENAMDMIERIKKQYRSILMMLDWMDEKTKKAAVEKLNHMYAHIAYPDELLNDELIEKYYADLNTDVKYDSLLLTILQLNKFQTKLTIKKLRQPVDRKDWMLHGRASVVNAFYSPVENSIQFPAGVFQGMFYAADRPEYLNYGCIGYTIGHEITHGFDDRGRQFDKNGLLSNWWDEETKNKFIEKTKCIIYQYGNFSVKVRDNEDRSKFVDSYVNGNFTQGENIADNGGMKIAYVAYNDWAKTNPPETSLPGFEQFSHRQMFWLSAANKWCSKIKPEMLENLLLNDPHSPGKFRIDGPMMNIPEFSRDWNCPLGSKMNPKVKCSIWAEGIEMD